MKNIALLFAFIIMLTGCTAPQFAQSSTTENSSKDLGNSSDSNTMESSTSPQGSLETQSSSVKPIPPEVCELPPVEITKTAPEVVNNTNTTTEAPNPAKNNWTAAYDSFYSGIDGVKTVDITIADASHKIRDNRVYPIYQLDTEKEIDAFIKNGSNFFENPYRYGAILENLDGSYYGEGQILNNANSQSYEVNGEWKCTVGEYRNRSSMTITEGIEEQLLKGGFKPETTKAYSVMITAGFWGTLFEDGDLKAFSIQTGDNFGIMVDLANLSDYTTVLISERINPDTGKPVIYLYPETELDVNVKVNYTGDFTYTYPTYTEKGWDVTAYPDGRLVNKADDSEHYYLFWEGNKKIEWDFSEGFIVSGKNTEEFLKEKLSFMGLTPREYNDFITYWVPEMIQNDYNVITFVSKQYEELAPMVIYPRPDSVLRVHMVYKKWDKKTQPKPQELQQFERQGFTAVEWGGTRG